MSRDVYDVERAREDAVRKGMNMEVYREALFDITKGNGVAVCGIRTRITGLILDVGANLPEYRALVTALKDTGHEQ